MAILDFKDTFICLSEIIQGIHGVDNKIPITKQIPLYICFYLWVKIHLYWHNHSVPVLGEF